MSLEPQSTASVVEPSPAQDAVALPSPRRGIWRLLVVFGIALAMCAVAYLAVAVPGRWFSGVEPVLWGARDLQVTRGQGRIAGDELLLMPSDTSGIVVVSVKSSLKSADFPEVTWIAIDVPEQVDASLLWRTDVKPGQLNTISLRVVSGRLLPATTHNHPAWIGRIEGLALALRGPIAEPVRIRGIVAKPETASDVLKDRLLEWFAFEGWTGTSINTVTGGADLQDLPLPLLLAAGVLVATLIVVALRRWRPSLFPLGVFGSLAAFTLAAWLLLDARWIWNLVRQTEASATQFAGKSWQDKRLTVEDGPLFAFVEKAKQTMPRTPVRVFVAADSHYFRGRAAYHLYPHNVYFDPRANTIVAPEHLRSGDWMLVYQRKGVQFDQALGKLRWEGTPIDAELMLAVRGGALFRIR